MGKVGVAIALFLRRGESAALSLIPVLHSTPLQVYKTLSDSVILDWYISLYDKDRMSSCTVTYSPAAAAAGLNATSEALEEGGGGDSVVLDFLPRRRTFLLQSLSPNTTYQFVMECADFAGRNYATKSITFQTGMQIHY